MIATLEHTSKTLLEQHHQNCLFKTILKDARELSFTFDAQGNLKGRFYCHEKYQGYNNRIHGGILAALIDESMVHCLMGYGIVGVTVTISIKYRLPVYIRKHLDIITSMSGSRMGGVFSALKSELTQDKKRVVTAEAKFYTKNELTQCIPG